MIGVTILGSTGSIGVSTLDVLSRHQDKYKVVALTANVNVETMAAQCLQFSPEFSIMQDSDSAEKLQKILANQCATKVLSGAKALQEVASLEQVDYVMAAIVGAAGLLPTLAAAKAGKRILLANKEALVMTGSLFMQEVADNHAQLLPIDSEHNAIFQCLPEDNKTGVDKIILTASGGPFLNYDINKLSSVTPEQACNHPNWEMGRKISVDSATMMNKGLEVIEATWLFQCDVAQVEVIVHPQSVIHSMVQYADGSVLAQLGNPDMRTPIAHAIAWPERMISGVKPLDFLTLADLSFKKMDFQRFPCLHFAYQAIQAGGTTPAILNAANEIAVEKFLAKKIKFTDIATVIEKTLENVTQHEPKTIEDILIDDNLAREYANKVLN